MEVGPLVESASQLALGASAGPVAAGQPEMTPGGEQSGCTPVVAGAMWTIQS
jgi:hypothetical protein